MKRDEKYLAYFAGRNFDAQWQRDNCYTDIRVETHKRIPVICMTTIKGHALKSGKKFFYDFECDFCFEFSRWIDSDPNERKQVLMRAMGF